MKTNITLKVDQNLVREAKVLAAQQGTSVSRLLAEQLEELIRRGKSYDSAMQRAMKRLRKGHDLGWAPPTRRQDLHER